MAAVRVSLRALRRAPLATLGSLAGDGPDAVTFRAGPVTIHLATNPELIRDVFAREHKSLEKGRGLRASRRVLGDGLLTSEGEVHRRARRLVQPLFHRKEIARYADIMVAHATRLSASWTDGEAVDMHAEMGQLALAIVAESLFGSSIGTPASRDIARALKVSVDMFGRAGCRSGASSSACRFRAIGASAPPKGRWTMRSRR
jgi:cytochrome P450